MTSFFRDPQTFEVLKKTRLPRDPEDQDARTRRCRVWVPGCSTGQEAYSLAIALVEFLDDKPVRPPIQIFATDLSDTVSLEKARDGVYPESIEAEVSPERLRRFFTKDQETLPDQQVDPRHVRLRPAERDGGPALLPPGPDQLPQRADLSHPAARSGSCRRSTTP